MWERIKALFNWFKARPRAIFSWLKTKPKAALFWLWQKIKMIVTSRNLWLMIIIELIFISFIWGGYSLPIWSGFGDKVWWDWMQLIIVPIILASGGLLLNTTFQQTERKRAQDSLMDNIFQSYLDDMANLLIEKDLQKELDKNNDEDPSPIVTVARARTVTALRSLDEERRGLCLNFLREAKLIIGEKGTLFVKVQFGDIDLSDANLYEVNLSGARLEKANLSDSILIQANLSRTYLYEANLSGALLYQANLSRAYLDESNLSSAAPGNANLSGASLRETNLSGAFLNEANLSGAFLNEANLRGAKALIDEQLARASSFEDATMPDGTIFDVKWEKRLLPLKPRTHLMEAIKNEDDLSQLDLKYSYLGELDLSKAVLLGLDLSGANLDEANLSGANLNKVNLNGARLYEANLRDAFLMDANLSGAQNLTDEQLAQAESLEGATMPDGTLFDEAWEAKLAALREKAVDDKEA